MAEAHDEQQREDRSPVGTFQTQLEQLQFEFDKTARLLSRELEPALVYVLLPLLRNDEP